MSWTPEIPTFRRAAGKDGKIRLYLLAGCEMDIEVMLTAAGLLREGIHRQQARHFDGWYRIIRPWEEKLLEQVFPQKYEPRRTK
ncbi:MAG: hypothetical protein J7639_24700 [Paenibacillaceae bacterium]|nr:hypothetical protein [Paenibacillaceae bacterium]